jgi:cellulose synthase/poly-beta-1,6-N-acetylglucosamine synthase-like glycosyltransferase
LWLTLFFFLIGSYLAYFGYLKFNASKPWGLKVDPEFCPPITILVPVHNEEKRIENKLENIAKVLYPKEKMEIIVIDDASTDETFAKANAFAKKHSELKMKVLKQGQRKGKAMALNKGLEVSSSDIIVMTDADTLWSSHILHEALPYVADSTVGAITGMAIADNSAQSWVTKAESGYMSVMSLLRLGESKVYSTIRFEGCFCIFKKNAFDEFDSDSGADDSGTALRVVQNNLRAILVPEARALAEVPSNLRDRTRVKIRRATHLNGLWFQCLKLLFRHRLILPKRIAVPEILISIIDPIIFVALACTTFILLIYHPIFLVPLLLMLVILSVIPKTRGWLVYGIMDQLILFYSVILCLGKKKFITWQR